MIENDQIVTQLNSYSLSAEVKIVAGETEGSIEIITIDERLSSLSAKHYLIQQGVKTGHNKGRIDELAAAIILQQFLDKK